MALPSKPTAGVRLARADVLPPGPLGGGEAFARGRAGAATVRLGRSAFLEARGAASELEVKRRMIAERRFSFHAQIGYRAIEDSRRAWAGIHDRLAEKGAAPDRYGICLDWSMGYPAAERRGRPRGTGMILESPADFIALTAMAPVAPHFGDFVLGMPAAVENAAAALLAGSTTIGNLSQYFTFRLPGWGNDVGTTLATVEALGLIKAQPVPILIHSNLDDGYAAWFEDMGSALGFAMVERWIVEDLIGLPLGHCFGHTFSEPAKRLAFQIALARANPTPGTMLYGNTTLYGPEPVANYGALASYMLVDAFALWSTPSGQALTPIPVTEARRIPTVEEVVDAHLAARRLVERIGDLAPILSTAAAEPIAETLFARGVRFRDRLMEGLDAAGFDLADPAEVLLALRRIGPAELERRFGERDGAEAVASPFVDEIEQLARQVLAAVPQAEKAALAHRRPRVVVATTDVHFYGKRLLSIVLGRLGIELVDGGVSIDPDVLARRAAESGAEAVAVSTYNGVALSFVQRLKGELARLRIEPRVFIGGRLNEILDDAGTSLPVDVTDELRQSGAVPCRRVEDLVTALAGIAPGAQT
ncbi:cobalamin-dependent protein [Labrys wisconsinensis]|uniref:Methylmalonyl-CoA mutase cobalamin-binding subunit n=1 Tax=Labrys wisconsinensis TaxID=425677 RepID=A0ABU0J395_9HYPH|nr:cobalamin-dependent protein [Labrys wisconsinensis]MDQ0467908.1 methylmalonyl-CoA mutase cobalamin-binding subunit [Labrys wisconsinensis]